MLNRSPSLEVGCAVDIVGGTHKGKLGTVQSLTREQVYVTLPSGATVRVWISSVRVSCGSYDEASSPRSAPTLRIGDDVDIVEGSYKNKRGSIESFTRSQVYVRLCSNVIIRINRGSVVPHKIGTGRVDTTHSTETQYRYRIGASVVVQHHINFFTRQVLPEQGMLGEITKITRCYVWVRLFDENVILQKRKHNVRLVN